MKVTSLLPYLPWTVCRRASAKVTAAIQLEAKGDQCLLKPLQVFGIVVKEDVEVFGEP